MDYMKHTSDRMTWMSVPISRFPLLSTSSNISEIPLVLHMIMVELLEKDGQGHMYICKVAMAALVDWLISSSIVQLIGWPVSQLVIIVIIVIVIIIVHNAV